MKLKKDSTKAAEEKEIDENEINKEVENLELINSVNIALNKGKSLEEITGVISKKTKKLFYGSGIALYLLSADKKYLDLQNLNVPSVKRKKIEQLIKIKIPRVRLPLGKGSYYYQIIKDKRPVIINNDTEIKKIIVEFANALPENKKFFKKAIIKLVSRLYKILSIKSVMITPLVADKDVIGLIDISGKKEFTDFDLERLKTISEQMVTVIERKKMEIRLREGFSEIDQIFNSALDGMRVISKNFEVLKVNKSFTDLVSMKAAGITGKKCYEILELPECHTKRCILKRILNGEKYVTRLIERENKNNDKKFYSLSATPVINNEGRITEIVESFRDITLEMQSFSSMKSSEKKLRNLFNNMSSGVAVYEAKDGGKDFIISDFNKAAEKIEDIKKEDVVGRRVLEVFPAVKEFGLYDVFKRVYKTGKPEKHPISFYKDNRISGWRRNYVYSLGSGEIVSVYDDLTREKRAEKLLKDSEEFSAGLIENSPNPLLVINPDASIKYVNKALENLVGIKSGSILGKKPPYPWWPKESEDKIFNILKKAFKKGFNESEILLINKKGKKLWVKINAKAAYSDGNLKYLIINWVDLTVHKSMESNLKISYDKIKKTLNDIINALATLVETRDPYVSGHQKRVSKLSVYIAKELGLSRERIEGIETAAKIHDIGKINIPTSILAKPGKLTEIEFDLIKTHSQVGYDIIKEIKFPMPIADIILQHHEKIDGSGYPRGLKGEDIMLESKIITVADVVEAMSSYRPYRPALGLKAAVEEIQKNKGKLYEPDVVDACVSIVSRKGFMFN